MNKSVNVQKEMDKLIEKIKAENSIPTLLLQACCAPCSSYVLEYLSQYFKIFILFYNPNISPRAEYEYRLNEEKRLISEMTPVNSIEIIDCTYNPDDFFSKVKGLEKEPEGGARCEVCFELRLRETAKICNKLGCDYFATTLTISPLKNASLINSIGEKLAEEYNVKYLPSDFKKKNGYKRSIELSKEHNLYRQNYCGCIFSKTENKK